MYGDGVEAGTTRLPRDQVRRLKQVVDRGNQANMMRAVAFADPGGPRRWGLEAQSLA